MTRDLVLLERGGVDPPLAFDRGVPMVSAAERQQHAPDRTLLLTEGRSVVARASCWWTDVPALPGERLGVVGHYAAADPDAGTALLSHACELLAAHGCSLAIGPMDGNTWRRYRFVVERGSEPPFFLEPDNPEEWPRHWRSAGFDTLATYTSGLTTDPGSRHRGAAAAFDSLGEWGVSVRTLVPDRTEQDLRRIFELSLRAFSRNFLYTPIEEAEFLAQYRAVLPYVRPELVLLAERESALVGFVFAVPDVLRAKRGAALDSVVIKTLAVDPVLEGRGLGGALLDAVQHAAGTLGFTRAIHALMHETNRSKRISDRYARTIRRYELFSRRLIP